MTNDEAVFDLNEAILWHATNQQASFFVSIIQQTYFLDFTICKTEFCSSNGFLSSQTFLLSFSLTINLFLTVLFILKMFLFFKILWYFSSFLFYSLTARDRPQLEYGFALNKRACHNLHSSQLAYVFMYHI